MQEIEQNLTPLMRQYFDVKSRHQDCLLLFRMGDFFELFGDDAVIAARLLDIALTTRNKNDPDAMPMCGVPHHAVTHYLHKLVSNGHKVAVCEQLESPSQVSKGQIVKRDVVRIVSPGTQLDPEALDSSKPNLTHAARIGANGTVHWATCDFSTGHFWFGESRSQDDWEALLKFLSPSEVVIPQSERAATQRNRLREILPPAYIQDVPGFYFEEDYAKQRLQEQFRARQMDAVNPKLAAAPEYIGPCGALIKLFQETQKEARIPSLIRLEYWREARHMDLDAQTVAALDLLPNDRARGTSLYEFLNKARTAMGSRKLREWLLRPLTRAAAIAQRQDWVTRLRAQNHEISEALTGIYDIERLLTRVCNAAEFGTSNARDLKALAESLLKARDLAEKLQTACPELAERLNSRLPEDLLALARSTAAAIVDLPPLTTREGGLFRKGFHAELDELIDLTERGEQWLARYEADQRGQTGIHSLKVRFNRVFGYYIEVTKANVKNVPENYIRKQTMATAERYVTEELKSFEDKILNAEKRRTDLEHSLYRAQCAKFAELSPAIAEAGQQLSEIDAARALAQISLQEGFTAPQVDERLATDITDGFHPTVKAAMNARGHAFIANSVRFEGGSGGSEDGGAEPGEDSASFSSFLLVTGPNMGGKSTVMRQTALITLLAQMGSYVPAAQARIGVVDRIFTRIGSADNLAEGASTFMVEMSEMSFILRHATERSLILVDEIGRGTSTYDGLSLATAIAEHIASRIRARTLFATHYHELTLLAGRVHGVRNCRVGVRVTEKHEVEFLYKLEEGAAERSYGILVAKLAGLPENILERAQRVLDGHESQPVAPAATRKKTSTRGAADTPQLGLALQ